MKKSTYRKICKFCLAGEYCGYVDYYVGREVWNADCNPSRCPADMMPEEKNDDNQ